MRQTGGPQPNQAEEHRGGSRFLRQGMALWLKPALLALLATLPTLAQEAAPPRKLPPELRPAPQLGSAADSNRTSPEHWAQWVLDGCVDDEKSWKASWKILKAELAATAESNQRVFPDRELAAHTKSLDEQRRRHFARLDFVLLGQKAQSLAEPAERFRRAARLPYPQGKTPFRRTLSLLFGEALPCSLAALEISFFLGVFDLPLPRESLEAGLSQERISAKFEWAYRQRLRERGSLEEVYRTLRPQDDESALAYVDALAARLASAQPDASGEAERRTLLAQLQRYFRLTAEPVRIRAYLHAKVEEIEGALRTSIPDRAIERLFEPAENALYSNEAALRELAGSEPGSVVARLSPLVDAWFRAHALPGVQRALSGDPFSSHSFFVQTGGVARRPQAFAGSRLSLGPGILELESLKGLGVTDALARLRQERVPAEFVSAYATLEQALTEFSLSREEALTQLATLEWNPHQREKLRRYLEAQAETQNFSALDVYTRVVRDANRIGGTADWELVRSALRLLHQGKQQRLEQEIERAVNAAEETERQRLAGYLRAAGELLLEIESRQASELRFQEAPGGGVTRWLLRNLMRMLRRPGMPRQLWAPGGVTGEEFAELVDGLAPKNAESGAAYRRKPTPEIQLVHDGRDYHGALVEVIDTAGSFLNLSTFDWKVDLGGKEVAYRLMAKKLGLDSTAYERLLERFRQGVSLHPESASPTLFYDMPPKRIKNLLIYFFFTHSALPAIAEVRRELEAALGGTLACPSVATCGDLLPLRARLGNKYDPQRANEAGYQQAWEIYRKLEALFEEKPMELRQVRPRRSLADYVADGDRLRRFARRYGLKRADDPARPFDINVLVDAKQNLNGLRLGHPSRQLPYLLSDSMWDIYGPLYEFDIRGLVWKGGLEYPWHLGPLPVPGRKLLGVVPMPFLPYSWLRFVPGFGWAGGVKGLGLEYFLGSDPRVWWAMAMHVKNVSSEWRALETGMGFASKYFNAHSGFATWHDMGVQVQGEIVGDVNDHFVRIYNAARVNNSGLPGAYGLKIPRLRYPDYRYGGASGTGAPAWVLTTDPEQGQYNYRGVFLAALAAARKNIYIENAFFTDPVLGRLILRKAHEFRGRADCAGLGDYECAQRMREAVGIYLVLADSTDQPLLDVVGHTDVDEMRHLGVKIYRWNPARGWSSTKMMHTKAWLVDYADAQAGLAYVGSANATQRSHISDNEMGIVSSSPEFAREVQERLFSGDMKGDARPEATEKFHLTGSEKRLVRTGHWLRHLLVNVLWLF